MTYLIHFLSWLDITAIEVPFLSCRKAIVQGLDSYLLAGRNEEHKYLVVRLVHLTQQSGLHRPKNRLSLGELMCHLLSDPPAPHLLVRNVKRCCSVLLLFIELKSVTDLTEAALALLLTFDLYPHTAHNCCKLDRYCPSRFVII